MSNIRIFCFYRVSYLTVICIKTSHNRHVVKEEKQRNDQERSTLDQGWLNRNQHCTVRRSEFSVSINPILLRSN